MKKKLRFERIGDTDYFNLYYGKKLQKENITMDEVLKIIHEKEEEEKHED